MMPLGCPSDHTHQTRLHGTVVYLQRKPYLYVHVTDPLALELTGCRAAPDEYGWCRIPHWVLRLEHVPPVQTTGPTEDC